MSNRTEEAPRIETLEQAAAWLEGLINVERAPDIPYRRLGLGPIEALLARLGHPESAAPIVHVAGSKGKGSTCLLVEALLGELGARVGTFTSPHLVSWTERFRVAGCDVEGDALARAVAKVRPEVEALMGDPAIAPTFFDATTAAALVVFADAETDRIVLEVGLGGRLDSTNAVAPAVTAITSIELEHTDRLGNTLGAIAAEKAGILKPGVPCVVGALPAEAEAAVRRRADEVDAPLLVHGVDWSVEPAGQSRPGHAGRRSLELCFAGGGRVPFELGVPGRHQEHNAGVALVLVHEMLARSGEAPTDAELGAAAARAWTRLVLPGRLEQVGDAPICLVDAAHTAASAGELALHIDALGAPAVALVVSVSADKDIDGVLAPLLARARAVWATRAEPIRSLPAPDLAKRIAELAPGVDVHVEPDVAAACAHAFEEAGSDGVVCAAGSVYLAGAARVALMRLASPATPRARASD